MIDRSTCSRRTRRLLLSALAGVAFCAGLATAPAALAEVPKAKVRTDLRVACKVDGAGSGRCVFRNAGRRTISGCYVLRLQFRKNRAEVGQAHICSGKLRPRRSSARKVRLPGAARCAFEARLRKVKITRVCTLLVRRAPRRKPA